MADVRTFPAVPLVGQPLEVLGWTLLVYVTCQCQQSGFVPLQVKQGPLGRSADVGVCPACARAMHVASIGMNTQNQLEFGIEIGDTVPAPSGATS